MNLDNTSLNLICVLAVFLFLIYLEYNYHFLDDLLKQDEEIKELQQIEPEYIEQQHEQYKEDINWSIAIVFLSGSLLLLLSYIL